MTKFEQAVAVILHHEGVYVNDPRDPGGETKYGISKRAYPNENIKNLTVERAKQIYRRDYWDRLRCDQMPYGVALTAFDFGVNAGVGVAARMLQGIVGASNDGIIGPASLRAINAKDPAVLLRDYTTERLRYYSGLNGWKHYSKGWTRRILSVYKSALKSS